MELALVLRAAKSVRSESIPLITRRATYLNLPMVFVAKTKFGSEFGDTRQSVETRDVPVLQYQCDTKTEKSIKTVNLIFLNLNFM